LVQKNSCKSSQETQLTLNVWVKLIIKIYQLMLKEILNLEGVAVLSKEQQKSVNGGYRNCQVQPGSNHFIYSPGTTAGPDAWKPVAVAEKCFYTCETTFLGFRWGSIEIEADC
jgi:hypothetical protein